VAALSVFSPNESLEDIGTRDLVYLFVPYALSELCGRVSASEREERLQILDQGQVHADFCRPSIH
jgi:immunoglobulin-binding protein 1